MHCLWQHESLNRYIVIIIVLYVLTLVLFFHQFLPMFVDIAHTSHFVNSKTVLSIILNFHYTVLVFWSMWVFLYLFNWIYFVMIVNYYKLNYLSFLILLFLSSLAKVSHIHSLILFSTFPILDFSLIISYYVLITFNSLFLNFYATLQVHLNALQYLLYFFEEVAV